MPDAWLIVGMHGVGTGTHGGYMATREHERLLDWIAAQREWLESVTMLEAVARRPTS